MVRFIVQHDQRSGFMLNHLGIQIAQYYLVRVLHTNGMSIGLEYSLDCKEGHMKKKGCVCVCLHLGSKEHRFQKLITVTNDSWNFVLFIRRFVFWKNKDFSYGVIMLN